MCQPGRDITGEGTCPADNIPSDDDGYLRWYTPEWLAWQDRKIERWQSTFGTHAIYQTGDTDAPEAIKDRNGEVALCMCRACGRAEDELAEPCAPRTEAV